jgi:peptidoglycan/xylan/chitin deacetylase (PgdA/CDA1 family)
MKILGHRTKKLTFSLAGAVLIATSLAGVAAASLYPAGPPKYPAFVTAMCPPEPSGALGAAPNAIEGGKTVSLTFDDGPGPSVPAIMRVLATYHIRASFMNDDTRWPDLLNQEYNAGYLMGNHTGNHHLLTGLRLGLQLAEIDRTIQKTWGVTKTSACVFRPPYGGYDSTTLKAAALRNSGVWMWNDGTGDFLAQGSGSAYWIRHIWTSAVNVGIKLPHVVILLHDQHHDMPATVAALPIIIQNFLSRGYTFVDLLGRSGAPNTCPGTNPGPLGGASTSLATGTTLASGESRLSPNGEFTLSMQSDGNLVVRVTDGRVLWSSGTAGHAGATATFTANGKLVVADGAQTLWSSTGTGASTLSLGNNGNLVAMQSAATIWQSNSIWSTMRSGDTLRAGWSLYSSNGLCALTQKSSGALWLHSPNGMTIWTNGLSAANQPSTTLQSSGSLVTTHSVGGTDETAWSSQMTMHPGDVMTVNNTGHLVFTSSSGGLFYQTP